MLSKGERDVPASDRRFLAAAFLLWDFARRRQLGAFAAYGDFLLEYNEKVNLTAITDPAQIAVKHFADSVIPLSLIGLPQGCSLIDVGTGAGFPGVPLKIMRPDLSLTLLDSLQKRLTFLEQLSGRLGQENAFVHARAEAAGAMPALRGRFDVAASRAVARLSVLCEYCLPLVKVGGFMLALKGPDCRGELGGGAKRHPHPRRRRAETGGIFPR